MRQIKFRGKRIDNAEWVYGQYFSFKNSNDNENWIEHYIRNSQDEDIEVDEDTIGQYTGLKDKNGIEIYEGDILSIKDEVGNRGEVTVGFESGGFIIFTGLAWRYIGQYDVERNDIEVIGNVHDNKEKL